MKKKQGYVILCAVLLVLCIAAALVLIYLTRQSGSKAEQDARDEVSAAQESPKLTPPPTATPTPQPTEEPSAAPSPEPYVSPIDFEALQAETPDAYAWLSIPGAEISYPLMQHSTNDGFYLNHNSEGKYYVGGAIFTEHAYNGTDFTDPVTIAYGHQMSNGTMFGKLQKLYSDPRGMEECGEIIVYLPDRELHFTVFAAVPYDNRHILYTYDFSSRRMFNAFLDSIYSVRAIGAVFSSEVTASPEDQLLILSTCLRGNSQKRYLVLAKCEEDIY